MMKQPIDPRKDPALKNKRGIANKSAKLNDEQIRYIKTTHRTNVWLSTELEVSQSTISRVRNNQAWNHIKV